MALPLAFKPQTDTGLNDPTVTLSQSQATPSFGLTAVNPIEAALPITNAAGNNALNVIPNKIAKQIANDLPGVGARSDDSKNTATSTVQNTVSEATSTVTFSPEPNVLDQYYSYTYSAALYLMSPNSVASVLGNGEISIPPSDLLMQSGGITGDQRNPHFQNDYYIEKIEIEGDTVGKGTGGATNSTKVKMTVIETNGITLIPNLDAAMQSLYGGADGKKANYSAANYLLTLKFYGYDQQGNLVQCGQTNGGGSDPSACIVKYIPLQITGITFRLANRLVEYHIEATVASQVVATGQNRGSVPYNVELSATTVSDALIGGSTSSTPSPTDGRESTSTSGPNQASNTTSPANVSASAGADITIRKGILTAMNQYQQDRVKDGTYKFADTYKVVFTDPKIANAKVVVKGGDYKGTGMQDSGTASQDLDPNKQAMDLKTRQISFTAGQQVIQIIDQIVRNSTYVTDQANSVYDETTGELVKNGTTTNSNPVWYKINKQVTQGQYDPNRNDFAYNITYVISPYKITQTNSEYFSTPKFSGIHKDYFYTFTGENTQVLNFEQQYNHQYTLAMTGSDQQNNSLSANYSIKQNFYSASGQNYQGAAGKANEIGASVADYLYNSNDLAKVSMTIVGDPAYVAQGEVINASNIPKQPFLPDGTINFDSSEVIFRVTMGSGVDYDINTGLMNPNQENNVLQVNTSTNTVATRSYVYRLTKITSIFEKGSFKQTLEGMLNTDYINNNQNTPTTNIISNLANRVIPGVRNVMNDANSPTSPPTSVVNAPTTSQSSSAPDLNQPNPNPTTASPASPPTSNGGIEATDSFGPTGLFKGADGAFYRTDSSGYTSLAMFPESSLGVGQSVEGPNPLGIGNPVDVSTLNPEQIAIYNIGKNTQVMNRET